MPEAKKESKNNDLILTYLEFNSYLMTTGGVTILIDPLLEGALDFGIPWLYKGMKKTLPMSGLCESLPKIDCILITQGLDDHANVRTLTKLAANGAFANVPVVAPPGARRALEQSGMINTGNVQFLRHRKRVTIHPKNQTEKGGAVEIQATEGALVGPPWQTRENGYILRSKGGPSIYIEPHVEFNARELSREAPLDVVITPIVGQRLPIRDLVFGSESTVRLLETVQPKVVVPMPNSDVDISGPVARFVETNGSESDFYHRMKSARLETKPNFVNLTPGQDKTIQL